MRRTAGHLLSCAALSLVLAGCLSPVSDAPVRHRTDGGVRLAHDAGDAGESPDAQIGDHDGGWDAGGFDAGGHDAGDWDAGDDWDAGSDAGCVRQCDHRVCGPDSCGGTCGSCPDGQSCDESNGTCGTCAETDLQLCRRFGKTCGTFTGNDICGRQRTVACGSCPPGKSCNAATNQCEVCVPETDAQLCSTAHANCGSVSAVDRCGVARTANCGGCQPGFTCDVNHQCTGCTQELDSVFCSRHGAQCGSLSGADNCNVPRTVSNCGSCSPGQNCVANHCQTQTCKTDAQLCQDAAATCGSISVVDDCGQPRTVASCGSCNPAPYWSCTANHCLCQPESDAELCTAASRVCGPLANRTDRCGGTRNVASCGTCTAPATCQATGTCSGGGTPANDTCANAQALNFGSAGTATVSGTLVGATDDTSSGTCGGAGGPDVVYSFGTNFLKSFSATLTGLGSNSVLYLRSSCTGADIACSSTGTLTVRSLPIGNYVLFVDAANAASAAPFTLQVQTADVPANDLCVGAQPLALVSGGSVRAPGTTTGAADDTTGSCATAGGADVFYSITVPSPMAVTARVTASASSPSFTPSVAIRNGCSASATELGCAAGASGGATASATLAAGIYYIAVDSGATPGDFTLEVSTVVVAGDSCSTATSLTFDPTTHEATAHGSTVNAVNDTSGSCGSSAAADVVFKFTLLTPKSVIAAVTPDAGSSLKPAVYLRSICDQPTTEKSCVAATSVGTMLTANLGTLSSGDYWLWVDGADASTGGFTVVVSASGPPAPSNDTCASPQTLTFNAATHKATVTMSTAAAANDYTGGCSVMTGAHTGGDVVFQVTLASAAPLKATVTRDASDTTFRPAVYIRSVCASALAADEKGCANEVSPTGVATVTTGVLAAGPYYVIVDGMNGTSGFFTLEMSELVTPSNDTCAAPSAIAIDAATGTGSVSGDTSSATDDYAPSCGGVQAGKDVVYSFDVPAGTTKDVTLQLAAGASSTLRPVVSARRTCDQASTELGCNAAQITPAAQVVLKRLAGGTYYAFADGYLGTAGAFTLSVSMVDSAPGPANDTCASPTALSFDTTGKATASGSTENSGNDYTGTCGLMSGGDNVYSFSLSGQTAVSVKVTSTAAGVYVPAFMIRTNCASGAASDEVACKVGTGYTATAVATLGQGNYFLIVDGSASSSGSYDLEVQLAPPVNNDDCTQPETLLFSPAGDATVGADTTYADNSGDGSCNTYSGQDVVYTFTTIGPKSFYAVATPTGTAMRANVYLRSSCADPASEFACNVAASGGGSSISITRLAQGTYYLWVDTYSTYSFGPFTLQVSLTAPPAPPANDLCTGATQLNVDPVTGSVTVSGDTTAAGNDAAPTCDAGTGPDVVYYVVTTAPKKLVATVTRGASSTLLPLAYVRSTCDQSQASAELTCATSTAGSAVATVNTLPAGTWYIWVDGEGSTSGPFSLQVNLSAPASGPANDSCATPEAITISGTTAQVTGSTVSAQNDAFGSCSASSAGTPDVVYSLTTTAAQKIIAAVTPAGSYNPAVYIRRACGSFAASDELACAASYGGIATATARYAPAGTYWIWIDGSSTINGSGTFTLNVTLDTPILPPANDTCATPTALTLNTPVTGDTSTALGDYLANRTSSCTITYGGSQGGRGPDAVYTYTPAAAGTFRVTLTPTSAWDAVVWVSTGTCGVGTGCAAYADQYGSTTMPEIAVVTGATAGRTYYIYADGYVATSSGPYTIEVTP